MDEERCDERCGYEQADSAHSSTEHTENTETIPCRDHRGQRRAESEATKNTKDRKSLCQIASVPSVPSVARPVLRFRPMVRTTCAVVVTLLAGGCSRAAPLPPFPAGELVDLSHTFDEQTIYWPTSEPFRLQKDADGVTPAGFYYSANSFFTSEHGGTHLDAPVHFAQGRQSADEIPLERLFGPAVVVDVTKQSEANADYQVTVEDLAAAEREHGRIPGDAILLIRTGFSRRWPDAAKYLGTGERGPDAVPKLHFPGLHPDAARWVTANRPVRAIGIDTASIDYGQSTLFESHRVLYEVNLPAFENLTGLDRLPSRGAYVVALPMKIGGGTGAPLRAVAILPPR
jgi:kynurenine formamidase